MGSCSKRPSDVSQRGCLHSVVVLHLERAPEERFALRLAPIPYVGRMPYNISYRDVFRGESSFYFVLQSNLSFPGRSHQHVRKWNTVYMSTRFTKTVLHFRTEWYCRISLCPEM